MKKLLPLLVCVFMLASSACVVVTPSSKRTSTASPGKKKGWYKNRHNPHNPNTDNPGQNKKRFVRVDFY